MITRSIVFEHKTNSFFLNKYYIFYIKISKVEILYKYNKINKIIQILHVKIKNNITSTYVENSINKKW